jgi:hypothetical protein
MKHNILFILFSFVALASCNETKTNTNTENEVEVKTTEPEIEVLSVNYEQDWELFKEAIIAKDIQKVAAYFESDNLDAEQVIFSFHEDYVLPKFKSSTLNDLKTENIEGLEYLVFYAEITGLDDEGYEVGSSYSFYFSKGEKGLQLVYYIAAG